MENNTAKHFVLQLGSLITLYLSVSFLIVLLYAVINLLFPDATEYYYDIESATSSVRLGIAMLIVFFPAYLVLTRRVNVIRRKETNTAYLGLTKWLMYLSLLIGGGVLLGDAVAVILAFLEGELTTRFLLKAGVLLIVVGAAFFYYLQDARGYWLNKEKSSLYYALGMTVVVAASVVTGFFHTEAPSEVREMRLDETQISDLQQIQWKIEENLRISSTTLPATLEEAFGGFEAPQAPEDREAYTYETTQKGFNLCATFSRDSADQGDKFASQPYYDPAMPIKNGENWSYKQGRYCFERVVR
jgi:Domain of unknown function (DUF5671)